MFKPERSVEWIGDIEIEGYKKVVEKILELWRKDDKEPIYLHLSTPGGWLAVALAFYEKIRSIYKIPLWTIALGNVDSSGVIVFLAGQKRFITPNTTFLLHEIGRTFPKEDRFTARQLEKVRRHLQQDQDKFSELILANTGGRLTKSQLKKLMEEETILTTQEIVQLGFAHEIIT
jgi:ATP-dependent protease ClpP protease subunit